MTREYTIEESVCRRWMCPTIRKGGAAAEMGGRDVKKSKIPVQSIHLQYLLPVPDTAVVINFWWEYRRRFS